jgi:hypothetical protein
MLIFTNISSGKVARIHPVTVAEIFLYHIDFEIIIKI